jgi:nitrogen fixation protein NifU and related proteins
VSALYREIVLDHQRAPRRHGALAQPSHASDGVNALCGDALRVELRISDGRIADYAFRGECCAIATATASLIGDAVHGREVAAVAPLERAFAAMIAGEAPELPLGELDALAELVRYPARRKCALLPWATLTAALAGEPHATTEKDAS